MKPQQYRLHYQSAVRDFDRARKKAALQQIMATLTGRPAELLSYNEVREKLRATGEIKRGLQEIPLDAIKGSVGRYKDFTRDFLPKRDSDEERWARVRTSVTEMKGMDPIEVYKVGNVYFVKDGNHRVSVARQLGTETISAYVTEVKTRVPLAPEDDPDEVICKARYVDFLERTNLDKVRPGADLSMRFCGQYHVLLDQIEGHRGILDPEESAAVTYEQVVAHWYDEAYLPVVELIREQGILRNFPSLTETDLYVLFTERWAEVEEALGWKIGPETAVSQLAEQETWQARSPIIRLGQRILNAIIPGELEEGPSPGIWREQRVTYGRKDRLFADYLVAIAGRESDWHMLDEVIHMAQYENDRLLGLHVVEDPAQFESRETRMIRERFLDRCRENGVPAEFAVEAGKVAETIIRRAAWVDLVVTSLTMPPGRQPVEKLGHGFNHLVQRCPRPIIAIPAWAKCSLDRLLLAYDGSAKAGEALFVATYLKSRWPIDLVVVTVETEHTSETALDQARNYISQYRLKGVKYLLKQRPIAEAILETAEAYRSTMLIMGGFGFRPLLHLVLGSTVDQILRESKIPVLICR